jgi:hypothetical protein
MLSVSWSTTANVSDRPQCRSSSTIAARTAHRLQRLKYRLVVAENRRRLPVLADPGTMPASAGSQG